MNKKGTLEKIFTSKTRIKIMGYFFFYNQETYLREVVRELNLSSSIVKREIDNLLSIGLILRSKNKLVLNNSNVFLDDLKRIFLKTDFFFYPIKKALDRKEIKFVLIFGSFANNNHVPESDIDLLIIGDLKQEKVFKILKPLEIILKREINPIVWTLKELIKNKEKAFIRDILKKEKIIIKGNENEFQKVIR